MMRKQLKANEWKTKAIALYQQATYLVKFEDKLCDYYLVYQSFALGTDFQSVYVFSLLPFCSCNICTKESRS